MQSSSLPDSEYSTVIRLYRPLRHLPGHTYIATNSQSPPNLIQLCRHLTLARGRVLYEVYDRGYADVVGYVVPAAVARYAREYRNGVDLSIWNELEPDRAATLKRAQAILRLRFPRMPEYAAKEVAEFAESHRWRGDGFELQQIVVKFVKRECRVDGFASGLPAALPQGDGAAGEEARRNALLAMENEKAFEAVKPRMREILRSWMRAGRDEGEVRAFWRRHGLLDAQTADEPVKIGIQSYGGLETIANMRSQVQVFS